MANGNRRPKRAPAVPPVDQAPLSSGVGSRYAETFTREPDLGGGLPRAPFPVVAVTPAQIARRAIQKREANRRRGSANNVAGYVAPADPNLAGLPSAEELLRATNDEDAHFPSAEELLSHGQGFIEPSDPDSVYVFPQISPTRTINPMRPRTLEAGYEKETATLRVRFRDGTPWEYYDVPPNVWQNFKRVKSPGRFINRTLNNYDYQRGDF